MLHCRKNNMPIVIAQFSDCHLFSDTNALHHDANVYKNLQKVIANIAINNEIDYVVFTGDLTQDHSVTSYQHFVDIVEQEKIEIPVLYLSGNHDDPRHMNKALSKTPFIKDKQIQSKHWQILLLDSKGDTPAGHVSKHSLQQLSDEIDSNKFQLLMMHHHPVDVGYFIDKHGLDNQKEFWQTINNINIENNSIKAVACGHVHQALAIFEKDKTFEIQCADVYACPATSIQFDPDNETGIALTIEPAYQIFYLYDDGNIKNKIVIC